MVRAKVNNFLKICGNGGVVDRVKAEHPGDRSTGPGSLIKLKPGKLEWVLERGLPALCPADGMRDGEECGFGKGYGGGRGDEK